MDFYAVFLSNLDTELATGAGSDWTPSHKGVQSLNKSQNKQCFLDCYSILLLFNHCFHQLTPVCPVLKKLQILSCILVGIDFSSSGFVRKKKAKGLCHILNYDLCSCSMSVIGRQLCCLPAARQFFSDTSDTLLIHVWWKVKNILWS